MDFMHATVTSTTNTDPNPSQRSTSNGRASTEESFQDHSPVRRNTHHSEELPENGLHRCQWDSIRTRQSRRAAHHPARAGNDHSEHCLTRGTTRDGAMHCDDHERDGRHEGVFLDEFGCYVIYHSRAEVPGFGPSCIRVEPPNGSQWIIRCIDQLFSDVITFQ